MFKQHYAQMFQCNEPDINIRDQLFEYLNCVGDWSDESIRLDNAKKSVAQMVRLLVFVQVWFIANVL